MKLSYSSLQLLNRVLANGGAVILRRSETSRANIAISDAQNLRYVREAVGSGTPIVSTTYIKDVILLVSKRALCITSLCISWNIDL